MKTLILFLLLGPLGQALVQAAVGREYQATQHAAAAAAPVDKSDEALMVRHAEVPLYPPAAKLAHLSGTVRVQVTVKDGAVVNTELVESSAHAALVNATTENLKTWRFWPNTNATFVVTYIYILEKDEAPFPENPRIEMQLPRLVKITARPTKPTCSDCVNDQNR